MKTSRPLYSFSTMGHVRMETSDSNVITMVQQVCIIILPGTMDVSGTNHSRQHVSAAV